MAAISNIAFLRYYLLPNYNSTYTISSSEIFINTNVESVEMKKSIAISVCGLGRVNELHNSEKIKFT